MVLDRMKAGGEAEEAQTQAQVAGEAHSKRRHEKRLAVSYEEAKAIEVLLLACLPVKAWHASHTGFSSKYQWRHPCFTLVSERKTASVNSVQTRFPIGRTAKGVIMGCRSLPLPRRISVTQTCS